MRVRKTRNSILGLVAVAAGLATAGCTITVAPRDGTPATPPTITVKAVNRTGKPLDPQLYVASTSAGLDGLFAAANQQIDFGFAGLGLIESNKDISFTVGCDQQVYIATLGGAFGDDLNNPVGQGQQIVLEQELSVHCGDVVTFTYTAVGSSLRTSVAVQPQ